MATPSFLRLPADVSPNTTGLPGIAALERIVGALLTIGLVAAVAGDSHVGHRVGDRLALLEPSRRRARQDRSPGLCGRGDADRRSQHPRELLQRGRLRSPMTTRQPPRRARRRFLWFASAGGLALVGIVSLIVSLAARGPGPTSSAPSVGTPTKSAPAVISSPPAHQAATVAPADPAAYEIQRLRTVMPVEPDPAAPTISGEAAQQPDLYAAELVRRLLTQDYRTSRTDHLRWVQAESAVTREPLVVGLIPPELRNRYAVFSVTDATDAPAPVPTATQWKALGLQQGYTSVRIDRVEEPLAWTNAVASGRITDPGITGRDVAATVVRHTTVDGHARAATFSVAISVNLEGPPSTATWRFVAALSYTAIQVS